MKTLTKTAAIALAATTMATAAPASATIFEYRLSGDGGEHTLRINTDTEEGSVTGSIVNASFTSPDFADFQGGEFPSLMATLTSMTGTRIVNGQRIGLQSDPRHPEMLKTKNNGTKWNLWATWGDPVLAGDFVRKNTGYTEVPAPGMLGLFGLALAALGLGRRRRKLAA